MHLIHRQHIELTVERQTAAREVQETVHRLYWEAILPRIEALFSRLEKAGITIRMDRLELDLGVLPTEALEPALLSRLEEKLTEELSAIISQGAPKGADAAILQALKTEEGQNGMRVINQSQEPWELLHFFLQTGLLPWWSGPAKGRIRPVEILEEQIKNDPGRMIDFLQHHSSEQVARRLIAQFPRNQLRRLLEVQAPVRARRSKQVWQDLQRVLPVFRDQEKSAITLQLDILLKEILLLQLKSQSDWSYRQIAKYFIKGLVAGSGEKTTPRMHLLQQRAAEQLDIDHPLRSCLEEGRSSPAAPEDTQPTADQKQADRPEAEQGPPASQAAAPKQLQQALQEGIYIDNAGLVLLAPFLPALFDNLGLTSEKAFISTGAREEALCLTHYLVTGSRELPEEKLMLNKLLCGWPPEAPVGAAPQISERALAEAGGLLQSVIRHWKALKRTSPDGLREGFLQREGRLQERAGHFHLLVDRKTQDILLGQIPWGFGTIKLPWMEYRLHVEW